MTTIEKHLFVRDARDRLIDLLGLGETSPLRDLPVPTDRLTAPPSTAAVIPIEASQRDCIYSLWERDSQTAVMRVKAGRKEPAEVQGNGAEALLETPVLQQDICYRIMSTRTYAPLRTVSLFAMACVRMGLNTALSARVTSGAPLDPLVVNPADTDPRIVDHGAEVLIQIDHSQSRVVYRLVRGVGAAQEEMSTASVRGDLSSIVLRSKPITDDTTFRILATMAATPPSPSVEMLLDTILPVVVRPNTALTATLSPSPIADHGKAATVTISGSQKSVRYQLYRRPIGRDELSRPSASDPKDALKLAGEGGRVFTVTRPALSSAWVDLPGFTAVGSPVPGNGGALALPIEALTEDCLIIVQAQKDYTLSGGRQVSTSVPLRAVMAVLVRPDPAPALRLRVVMRGDVTSGTLRVEGGQPGVFYHWSKSQGGADLGRPAYVYERLGAASEFNRGIGALVVGEDLVVGRDGLLGAGERATRRPEVPIVDTGPLPVGTTLYGLAVRAKTGLFAPLTRTATIGAIPALDVNTTTVVEQDVWVGAK